MGNPDQDFEFKGVLEDAKEETGQRARSGVPESVKHRGHLQNKSESEKADRQNQFVQEHAPPV